MSRIEGLQDATRVSQLLRSKAIRELSTYDDANHGIPWGNDGRRVTIGWSDCPVPSVVKLALTLI